MALQTLSAYAVPLLLLGVPLYGLLRGLPVYELFAEGVWQGIRTCRDIFPYLLTMLVAIGVFTGSGAAEAGAALCAPLTERAGVPPQILPLAILRPLSGSGALAYTAELLQTYGPDSFIGYMASIMQGSTETTFYVLAVYFGAVGINDHRRALAVGLSADLVSFIAAYIVARIMFTG
ncbi:MAG: spore maturation protein [Bacillota bacterium]|nr:spore maturation protein [Bacillota bacterium]